MYTDNLLQHVTEFNPFSGMIISSAVGTYSAKHVISIIQWMTGLPNRIGYTRRTILDSKS